MSGWWGCCTEPTRISFAIAKIDWRIPRPVGATASMDASSSADEPAWMPAASRAESPPIRSPRTIYLSRRIKSVPLHRQQERQNRQDLPVQRNTILSDARSTVLGGRIGGRTCQTDKTCVVGVLIRRAVRHRPPGPHFPRRREAIGRDARRFRRALSGVSRLFVFRRLPSLCFQATAVSSADSAEVWVVRVPILRRRPGLVRQRGPWQVREYRSCGWIARSSLPD